MKKLSLLLMLMLAAALGATAQQPENPAATVKGGRAVPVVKIIAGRFDENRNFQRALAGSGVLVDARGLVVTSENVVFPAGSAKEYPEIWVGVMDERRTSLRPNKAYRLRLVARDERLKLAVLKIEGAGAKSSFPAVRFGETGTLRYGQDLLAAGFMQANGTSLSTAEVSYLDYDERRDLLKVEGQFMNGIAGGAILDADGRLIGIPVAAVTSDSVPFFNQDGEQVGQITLEQIGLVVPVEAVQEFLRSVPNLVSFTIPSDLRQSVLIEGAVTDRATNRPVRGATIGILLPNPNSRQYIEADEVLAYARTDARGAFQFNRRLRPGTYSVKVVHPDYKTEYKTIRIPDAAGRLIFEMTPEGPSR